MLAKIGRIAGEKSAPKADKRHKFVQLAEARTKNTEKSKTQKSRTEVCPHRSIISIRTPGRGRTGAAIQLSRFRIDVSLFLVIAFGSILRFRRLRANADQIADQIVYLGIVQP